MATLVNGQTGRADDLSAVDLLGNLDFAAIEEMDPSLGEL
jgi:hypothetical protein